MTAVMIRLLCALGAVAAAPTNWSFATGSYGCASDEGDTFDGAVADAEAFCEARGCVGLLIESGADPCAEPHENATFTACRRMLGPTVQPVRNCFYCPGPTFDCGMAGDART